jgi:hypothetical protein
MNSNTQVFSDFTPTFRTLLRSPKSINFTKELSSLPTHILDNSPELTKRCVEHMFPKHPFGASTVSQVFHENHITSVTKSVGLFKVKVFPGVVDCVMKSCYFNALFLVVLRPSLFSRKPTLQQFQLALQFLKKLWRSYKNTVTGRQELFQPNINPNRMSMRNAVWNADITLNADTSIPLVGFPQDSYLAYRESCRNGSVQVNGDCANLGQLNMQIRYRILLKLGKQ